MNSRECNRVVNGLPPIPGHCHRCDSAIHALTPRDPETLYRGDRVIVLDSDETAFSAERFDWLPDEDL